MSGPFESAKSGDRPEPDEALERSTAHTADHDPADADGRVVEFDDPEATNPPVDDEERDPGRDPDASPGAPS